MKNGPNFGTVKTVTHTESLLYINATFSRYVSFEIFYEILNMIVIFFCRTLFWADDGKIICMRFEQNSATRFKFSKTINVHIKSPFEFLQKCVLLEFERNLFFKQN